MLVHRPKLTSSVISDVKPIIYIYILHVIIPAMTNLINMSFSKESVLIGFKKARARPLLKRSTFDTDYLKKYRSVSNLPFLSKQCEQVVTSQLTEHLSHFDLAEPFQSAYMTQYSSKMAVLHVQNDILRSMDEGKVGVLRLLYLSSAFDTVDHGVFLCRLLEELGIGVSVLDCLTSCLAN